MRAGELRDHIEIWQYYTNQSASGEQNKEKKLVCVSRAKILRFNGSYFESAANREFDKLTITFVIRKRPNITTDMLVKFGNEYYKIVECVSDLHQSTMQILTEKNNDKK